MLVSPRGGSILCCAVGLLLLALGIQKWTADPGPETIVAAFLEAVKAGNQEQSLALLAPRQQELARDLLRAESNPWRPSPRLDYEIEKIEETGNRATAHVLLKESGVRATSDFELRRTPEGVWQIREIHSQPVASFHVGQPALDLTPAAAADAALERELREALLKAPGVIVHREQDTEAIRR